MKIRAARFAIALTAAFVLTGAPPSHSDGAEDAQTFQVLAGRWTGEGRLGLKESPPENVKCRATYFVGETPDDLKQTIRCATAGGSIEVLSQLKNVAGQLSGTWKETTRNLEGELEGAVRPNGLRIVVKGRDLSANMDILVKADKQIIEIQFNNSSLVGLSLLMTKG